MFKVAIITVSDKASRGEREDKSGEAIKQIIGSIEGEIASYEVIPDEVEQIFQAIVEASDKYGFELVLTTGGTGLSPRDVTPEATKKAIHRDVPGIPELMRNKTSLDTPNAYLSRAVAGVRNQTLVINLPGSPKGVRECLEVLLPILPHAIEILTGATTECFSDSCF